MTFRVGQRVVCVDDAPGHLGRTSVINGRIYTITAIYRERMSRNGVGFVLAEVTPVHGLLGFMGHRFRPLIENKSTISFTQGAPKDSERFDNRRKVRVPA